MSEKTNKYNASIDELEKIKKEIEADVNEKIKTDKSAKYGTNPLWHDLIERANNFHWNLESFKKEVKNDESFYSKLHIICESINDECLVKPCWDSKQILNTVFLRTFNFILNYYNMINIFGKDTSFHDDVKEACYFYSLCMFIHHTKNLKSMSIGDFLYEHSPLGYNKRFSGNYFDYKYTRKSNNDKTKCLSSEKIKFARMRDRLLASRTIRVNRSEWSAIPASSKHEWAFYSIQNSLDSNIRLNDELAETYKRMGNLHKDIYRTQLPQNDKDYLERDKAYKKFSNKIDKIKYDKFLELSKVILEHIRNNEQYYGMNLYRFERMLRVYNITNEVREVMDCNGNEAEEAAALLKIIALNEIEYPQLYNGFASTSDSYIDIRYIVEQFIFLKDKIATSNCLCIDFFIKKGWLGEDWKNLLLNEINDRVERVLYDPNEIDYSVKPESQKAFEKIRDMEVKNILRI